MYGPLPGIGAGVVILGITFNNTAVILLGILMLVLGFVAGAAWHRHRSQDEVVTLEEVIDPLDEDDFS